MHVVGASSLAAGHKTLIPELIDALKKMGAGRYLRHRRRRHPAQDYAFLQARGVAAIYGPWYADAGERTRRPDED